MAPGPGPPAVSGTVVIIMVLRRLIAESGPMNLAGPSPVGRSIYEMFEADERTPHTPNWRMRRSLLFSAAFIGLVLTVSNHRTHITQPTSVTGLSASALSDTEPRKQILDHDSSPQKVKVRVYTESNCPACKAFTTQYLGKILAADGVSS